MAAHLRSMAAVAVSTLGSRLLGLLRDMLLFAVLGAGALSSAFLIAFTIPNLFRRLLGEGALTSAFVPVMTEATEAEGKERGFLFLNRVLTRLLGLLLVLVVLLAVGYLLLALFPLEGERWDLAKHFGPLLAPYLALVCLAAVLGAALNVLGGFTLAALSAVWLNLSMIVALGVFGYALGETPEVRARWLCLGVLVGGVLQVALPALALFRHGWRPRADVRGSEHLSELHRLFLPGLLGAGIVQINIAVSRLLAFGVSEAAVAQLYLANRLVELPMGLFAIAITTVAFPRIARFQAQGNAEGVRQAYGEGVGLIHALTFPAAAGLFILAEPILRTLFEWGRFDAADVEATATLLRVFALTVPLYSLTSFCTRAFHAMKDTRFPVRVAFVAFVVNTAASLALMGPLGALGLALANLLSVLLQVILLGEGLMKRIPQASRLSQLRGLLPIVAATATLALVACYGWLLLQNNIADAKQAALAAVGGLIPLAATVYFAVLLALSPGFRRLLPALRRPARVKTP
ncbi:MAG: murein biosynthesis integral membrane protein MurJ [Opitutales bacterium]